jgi:GNAT superfamily N-acetyltransferase
MSAIYTQRLTLIALTPAQLRHVLDDPAALERDLNLMLARSVLTDVARRAIGMKLVKLTQADLTVHDWYTYWLIVVNEDRCGAGLAGFKGVPDAAGEVEIGYGIAPEAQGRGYMSEAVAALIAWAFAAPDCQSVIAPGVLRTNPASSRVLQKAGMHVYAETSESISWRINRV